MAACTNNQTHENTPEMNGRANGSTADGGKHRTAERRNERTGKPASGREKAETNFPFAKKRGFLRVERNSKVWQYYPKY